MKDHKIDWARASEKFKDLPMFGKRGISPADIAQGDIGNCWFMAAISGYAEYTDRVEKMFVQSFPKNGMFALNLFALGVPVTILIDDYLAFMDGKD